jgi:bacteriocin-like protein
MTKSKQTKSSKGTKATKKSVTPTKTQKKHSAELSDDDLKQVSGGTLVGGAVSLGGTTAVAGHEKWIEASPLKVTIE